MKRSKKTYLVNEEDLETINYDEPQEDLFEGESILAAANKVFDYKEFKKQQENAIQDLKERWMEDAETINYLDDINTDDLKENKNLKIAAKKISDKYRKLTKRRASTKIPESQKLVEEFVLPKKKTKRQTDKTALLAAQKISKRYKNIRFR